MQEYKKAAIRSKRERYETLCAKLKELNIKTPETGWIKSIRQMLGMTATQLANRTGLDVSTISRLEDNEVEESITLKTLKKLADEMECELVYALVPKTRFVDILGGRAEAVIKREALKAEHTMALEDQGGSKVSSDRLAFQKGMLVNDLDKRLWED